MESQTVPVPSLGDWLKTLPRLNDRYGCAEKLARAGYDSVESIPSAERPETLIRDAGLPAFSARYIFAMAQEACEARKRTAAFAGLDRDRDDEEDAPQPLSTPAGGQSSRKQKVACPLPRHAARAGGFFAIGTLAPWLMEKYGEKARQARSGALHAAKQTPDALFEVMSAEDLTGPSPRAPIFTQWLSWTAVIFYRWRFSAFHDYDEYARGVAQLLLLSTPDEGGTTQLQVLPHQLESWLQKGDGPCLHELQRAMCGFMTPAEKHVALSEVLLATLKRATGKIGQYHTFLPLRVQEAPSADLERGMSVEAASAARLLYAALQPIRPHPDSQSYERFFMELDPGVLKSLTISTIFRFLRMALEVPAKEYLLLVPLVDGAQHARGRFGSERREKVTWHLQMIEQIVTAMNSLGSAERTLLACHQVAAGLHGWAQAA